MTEAHHGPAHCSVLVRSGQCSLQTSVSTRVLRSPRVHGSPKPSPMSPVHPNNYRKKILLMYPIKGFTMPLPWLHSPSPWFEVSVRAEATHHYVKATGKIRLWGPGLEAELPSTMLLWEGLWARWKNLHDLSNYPRQQRCPYS